MRIIYCTSLTYPSGLANRLQIFAMAKEFSRRLGDDFILGVDHIELPDAQFQFVNFFAHRSYVLAWKCLRLIASKRIDMVYSRERALLFFIWLYNKIFFRCNLKFFYEVHEFPDGRLTAMLFERMLAHVVHGYIFVTCALEVIYKKHYPMIVHTLVAPDGVDLAIFDIPISKGEARKKLNLPEDKFIIGYTGRFRTLGMEKGLSDVLLALRELPPNVIFLAMGGKQQDALYYQSRAQELGVADRVIFVEHFNQDIVALYQKASDVLVMPFPNNPHYAYYMSPMKMFEYMASGRPIIATDLPSVREVLSEDNALLVPPGDAKFLSAAVMRLLKDQQFARGISQQARHDANGYTWESRCLFISNFIFCS